MLESDVAHRLAVPSDATAASRRAEVAAADEAWRNAAGDAYLLSLCTNFWRTSQMAGQKGGSHDQTLWSDGCSIRQMQIAFIAVIRGITGATLLMGGLSLAFLARLLVGGIKGRHLSCRVCPLEPESGRDTLHTPPSGTPWLPCQMVT